MTDTPTAAKTSTAWHEAGHATALYLQGGELTYLSALPDATRWDGICVWKTDEHACCDCSPIRDAIVALAGPIAEARAQPLSDYLQWRRHATEAKPAITDPHNVAEALTRAQERHDLRGGIPTDAERARQLVADYSGSELEAAAMLRWVKYRALAMVQTPKFRDLARHLAGVLMDLGHIDGALATIELQRAELRHNQAREPLERDLAAGWEAEPHRGGTSKSLEATGHVHPAVDSSLPGNFRPGLGAVATLGEEPPPRRGQAAVAGRPGTRAPGAA
jgi:hypothetical protein